MLAFVLEIRIKPGFEEDAVRTLSEIELSSIGEAGCLQFTWFRDRRDPEHFLLVEQWRSQPDLDTHLKRIIPIWERFTPALAEEPRSTPLQPVLAVTV